MGIEKGVTEIPDSEDEPMTSSPVENTNLAQKSRGNEIGATQASRPELHKGHLKVPSEFDDSTTSKQNRNSNQAQVDDSLKGVGPSEKDHLANPQSSDHVLQAHIDLRSTAPSEEQPHEFESATNLSHPSKEQAQAGDISPSPTQQTRILSEGTEAKASDSLEQSAASGLVLFDTRETSASKELDGECDEHQRGGTEHDAAIAEEIKHETTIEVQGGDGQDVSQQQDIPQHELSRVEKGTTTQPLEDDGLCCASKSTMLPPASRVETAGMTEQVPLHSSCTSTSSQLEGSATLENPDANFSSDTKNSESHMEPETHGDRLQIVANHNNQEQVIEQQTTSNSDVPMPTAKITPGEHTGAENKSSSPLHILGTLDIDQHQSYTDCMLKAPVESEHNENKHDAKPNAHGISQQHPLPVPSSEASLDPTNAHAHTLNDKLEPPNLPSSPLKPPTMPKHPSPKKTSQETTLAELKAQRSALLASLATLPNVQDRMDDTVWQTADAEPTDADVMTAANRIVKDHIKLLHEYNEIKDVGQGLMGLIADQRGVRIVEVQDEFGIGSKD